MDSMKALDLVAKIIFPLIVLLVLSTLVNGIVTVSKKCAEEDKADRFRIANVYLVLGFFECAAFGIFTSFILLFAWSTIYWKDFILAHGVLHWAVLTIPVFVLPAYFAFSVSMSTIKEKIASVFLTERQRAMVIEDSKKYEEQMKSYKAKLQFWKRKEVK
jgi:hypothetical protein